MIQIYILLIINNINNTYSNFKTLSANFALWLFVNMISQVKFKNQNLSQSLIITLKNLLVNIIKLIQKINKLLYLFLFSMKNKTLLVCKYIGLENIKRQAQKTMKDTFQLLKMNQQVVKMEYSHFKFIQWEKTNFKTNIYILVFIH